MSNILEDFVCDAEELVNHVIALGCLPRKIRLNPCMFVEVTNSFPKVSATTAHVTHVNGPQVVGQIDIEADEEIPYAHYVIEFWDPVKQITKSISSAEVFESFHE